MSKPIRTLIVDDSSFVRSAVARMLKDTAVEVVGLGTNGKEAVSLARELRPDVIIMDINMPEMDGLSALKHIMTEAPTRVLMLSTLTREGAEITLQALELGAVDFIEKSRNGTVMDIYNLAPLLREKVTAIAGADIQTVSLSSRSEGGDADGPRIPASEPATFCEFEVVLIGASTGGPRALMEVVSRLPADFGASVVIAQHMPAGFTETLAERLNRNSPLAVSEARDGDELEPGRILIAPGGTQVAVERVDTRLFVRISEPTGNLLHRPSVNHLFASAATHVGRRAIGVVLTGMGEDGAEGLELLRRTGARTLVESAETAIIFGMPRAAREWAEHVLPISRIGPFLAQLCMPNNPHEGRRMH
ncbi:MAG TPA: chemotaxis response regulator protein-glutamate methylesterase [Longimicrobiaceae bacterium]|nr:chemotaxis response regulator protein-glutamate methylesterase [Longimicrobiaceae bacterium]